MGEVAPQAAEGAYRGDVDQALGLLRLFYGDRYTFGYDPEHNPGEPWWVMEDGRIGALLTAPTPEALGALIDSGTGTVPS
jgi:hypothetical protein